jgi:hypothetical protein
VDVVSEASELLGADVGGLLLLPEHSANLGLPDGTTYADALAKVACAAEPRGARDFVKAVLALRNDLRVQGDELEP